MLSINRYESINEPGIKEETIRSPYKVLFRYADLETGSDNKKISFTGKKALLLISVGQAYHEGEKFMATIRQVNKHQFSQCDIVLADSLQKHNYYHKMDENTAYEFAKSEGLFWLKRNAPALDKHTLPGRVISWDELLCHPDYSSYKTQIINTYDSNADFRTALHTNVENYIKRALQVNPAADKQALFTHGLNYLIEECPIVMPIFAKMGYDYIIYPNSLTPGMRKTRELFVSDSLADKCQWVFLKFRKRTQDDASNSQF